MPRRQSHKGAAAGRSAYPQLLAGEKLLGEPQQERSRRTREALLGAALVCFERYGYEATTIDEVARRAGVAVGAFYLHFTSKRQALLLLMDRLLVELAALELPEGTIFDAASSKAAVCNLVRTALRVDMQYLGAYRAWQEAILGDAALMQLHAQIDNWTIAKIVTLLRTLAIAPNARRDVAPLALAKILNALFWRLTEMRAGEDEELLQSAIAIVTHAIFTE